MKTKVNANPALYPHELRAMLADQPERLERALSEPCAVDLLTWNVFASLETHADRDWLAHRLQALGGPQLRTPLRISLWTGSDREPRLVPSRASVEHTRTRMTEAGADDSAIAAWAAPFEVPVRIESPETLVLVDTTVDAAPRSAAGRDRVVELIDAGLDHARRLGVDLAVGFVYRSGSQAAATLSARIDELRDPRALAAAMPWRSAIPPVTLREMGWQQLVRVWEAEQGYLDLPFPGVAKAFLAQLDACGLR